MEYDQSWRYEVGIEPNRLMELDDYLAEVAQRLGQQAIWRVAYPGVKGKAIAARESQ